MKVTHPTVPHQQAEPQSRLPLHTKEADTSPRLHGLSSYRETREHIAVPHTSRPSLKLSLREAGTSPPTTMTKSQFIKPGCFVDSHTTALVETPPNLPSHEPFSHRLKEPEIRTTRGRSFSLAGVPWEQVDLGKTISTPLVARILKIGVTLSASLILLGILLLPQTLQQISAWWLIIQPHIITLGLLALIATPVLSLVGSLLTFMRERDLQYVIITSIVLA